MFDVIPWWAWLIGVAVVLMVIGLLMRRRRPTARAVAPEELDMTSLSTIGPSLDRIYLECFGVPVRLAAVVIAPLGREASVPGPDRLHALFDQLVPGLAEVVGHDKPRIIRWPVQLSRDGFVHAFFNRTGLTTNASPWCAWAGRVLFDQQQLVVGFVGRSSQPTRLGKKVIENDGQWTSALRIGRPERNSA